MSRAATICPKCREWTSSAWREFPPDPGFRPVYHLSHRRRGGARCMAIRGEALNDDTGATAAGGVSSPPYGKLTLECRSERAESAPTAR